MSVRERVSQADVGSDHIVQFFDSDESRAECVADFLAQGYRAGEPAIVVARPHNWTSVYELLEARGIPMQQAMADGMIVVKDASDTVVGKAIATLARRGTRVRAYGEMVDMLAQRGELTEAIALEALWNR